MNDEISRCVQFQPLMLKHLKPPDHDTAQLHCSVHDTLIFDLSRLQDKGVRGIHFSSLIHSHSFKDAPYFQNRSVIS